jgi:hypothetical protein
MVLCDLSMLLQEDSAESSYLEHVAAKPQALALFTITSGFLSAHPINYSFQLFFQHIQPHAQLHCASRTDTKWQLEKLTRYLGATPVASSREKKFRHCDTNLGRTEPVPLPWISYTKRK